MFCNQQFLWFEHSFIFIENYKTLWKCLFKGKDEISVLPVLNLLVFLFQTMFMLLVILFVIKLYDQKKTFKVIIYNLHMAFNCWSRCRVIQLGLNKMHFPVQIIMLHCLSLCYVTGWWIDWRYFVCSYFFG